MKAKRSVLTGILNKKKWYFSIIEVIEILTGSPRSRKYWNAHQHHSPGMDGAYRERSQRAKEPETKKSERSHERSKADIYCTC